MKLFDKYESKEKLLAAIDNSILQAGDGFYFLEVPDPPAGQESDLASLRKELLQIREENDRLQISAAESKKIADELVKLNPDDLQEQIRMYVREKAELLTVKERLEKEQEQLRQELDRYREQELENRVRTLLHESASRLGIRPEAMRDVDRLIYLVYENEDGSFTTAEGRTIDELVRHELSLSPHWLPDSTPSGSHSVQPFLSSMPQNIQYETAKKSQDITGMILNAPIIE